MENKEGTFKSNKTKTCFRMPHSVLREARSSRNDAFQEKSALCLYHAQSLWLLLFLQLQHTHFLCSQRVQHTILDIVWQLTYYIPQTKFTCLNSI